MSFTNLVDSQFCGVPPMLFECFKLVQTVEHAHFQNDILCCFLRIIIVIISSKL